MTNETEIKQVEWHRHLSVRVGRGNREEGTWREDWANIYKEGDSIRIHLGEDEEWIEFSAPVVEAIYDLHQDVPH